jgi:uncharacterized protein (TIGR02001 family)
MRRVACAAVAFGCSTVSGLAADLDKKVTKAPPMVMSPWDIAFGSAIMSDYNFRGISQSNHRPSVASYFEPRYNFNDSLQGYLGLSGESISFPNRAGAEIDFYGGIRPTFGKLALDFGAWYYWYRAENASTLQRQATAQRMLIHFRPRVYLEAIHTRPALLRHRSQQGRLQRVHERPERPVRRLLHVDQPGRIWNQLVRGDIHR